MRYTTWGSIPAWAGETQGQRRGACLPVVYPRVGGGNAHRAVVHALDLGLSPRGRGKLTILLKVGMPLRSIPAWAGETAARHYTATMSGVYPRVGGGNRTLMQSIVGRCGLSPRGRGKPVRQVHRLDHVRSIPAWAGETVVSKTMPTMPRVYPRVGGGNRSVCVLPLDGVGLSPRGRGKLPAAIVRMAFRQVYPRVGGGNLSDGAVNYLHLGLSPRGRGKLADWLGGLLAGGSIPAWAGETCLKAPHKRNWRVYPRVGGGNTI